MAVRVDDPHPVPGGPHFTWVLDWPRTATHDGHVEAWAHHGIAVLPNGDVVTMSASGSDLQQMTSDGRLVSSVATPVVAGHSLTVVNEDGQTLLWVADNGIAAPPGADGRYKSLRAPSGQRGAAVKLNLRGEEVFRLAVPPTAEYVEGNYAPTAIVVDERHLAGSGDIWVADGYGQQLVHRYSETGEYLGSLGGERGLGRFDQPHALFIDRRRDEPELYVADRGNARIQVFDLEGRFRRGVGVGDLLSPGGFALSGTTLLVAELDARIAMFDADDVFLGSLGQTDPAGRDRPGWPNQTDDQGLPKRPELRHGAFNSPHGLATDAQGNIYVSEWLIGGRLVKLEQAR